MKSTPSVSEEEIRERMNFDALLEMRKSHNNRVLRRNSVLSAVLITTAAVLTYWFTGNDESQTPIKPQPQVAIHDSSATKKVQPKTTIQPLPTPIVKEKPLTKSTTLPPAENTASAPGDNYLEAEPLNGYPALYAYFDSELKYPEVALRDSIQGTESVSFIINKEGKPETITILHSLGSPFDEESRRLIINMPPWKPARLNSQPVRAKITIPLTFSITKNAHP
ncbi:MAG: energy transducer TonB [Cyclobacteriaceae bacterium]|jgi:TonB family protein|nr:energy transducer TonB [Cyclobacteriaceae bacterium]HQQ83223.1 energy transducer TonB [Cyclobacteriaceae bacterium]